MSYFSQKRGTYLRAHKEDAPTTSMPAAPKPVNSEIWSDGQLLGKTTMKGNRQKQESFMTPFQKQQQEYSQGLMPTIQERIFNPSGQDSWKAIADANKAEQMKNFDESFGKTRDNLIQNITSRGLQNSSAVPYMTNELAKTSADQLNSIENQYIADQQNARNQDFNYNSALYNLLNNGIGQQLQIQNNNLANANAGFNAGNNFNLANHQNQMNQWALQQAMQPQGGGSQMLLGSKLFGMNDADTIKTAAMFM